MDGVDDKLADREPHPHAAGFCGVERFENPLEMFPTDTGSRSRLAPSR